LGLKLFSKFIVALSIVAEGNFHVGWISKFLTSEFVPKKLAVGFESCSPALLLPSFVSSESVNRQLGSPTNRTDQSDQIVHERFVDWESDCEDLTDSSRAFVR